MLAKIIDLMLVKFIILIQVKIINLMPVRFIILIQTKIINLISVGFKFYFIIKNIWRPCRHGNPKSRDFIDHVINNPSFLIG